MATNDHAALLAEIAAELQDQTTEGLTVRAVVARTAEVVPEAQHVSLTVRKRRDTFATLAATSDLAERADELQYSLREGPCVDAALEAEWYRSGEAAHDPRWPRWGPRAGALGVRSLLSVRLMTQDQRVGALNMYSERPYLFDDSEVRDLALVYAVHVAQALSSARLVGGMETALDSRHVIGVALGLVMERYDMSEDLAFAFLRRLSSHQQRKLRDVATDLVRDRGAVGFGTGEGPDVPKPTG